MTLVVARFGLAPYILLVVPRFIPPALPVVKPSPPIGEGWRYELKFDGHRVQLHKAGATATIYSKNGADFTRRFPTIAAAIAALPVTLCAIDGELIAADRKGQPDFRVLLHASKQAPVCVYAFDLLDLQGKDLRDLPLEVRRAMLREFIGCAKINVIRFSENFSKCKGADGRVRAARF